MEITQLVIDEIATRIMEYVKVGSDWHKDDSFVISVDDYQPHEDHDLAMELGSMFKGDHAINSNTDGEMCVVIGRNWQKKYYA